MNTDTSRALYARAKQVMPGGVNSPVRAFAAVGMEPLFITAAEGATLRDADGNVFIDYVGSWGPKILGHNDPTVLRAAVNAARKGMSFGAPCEYEVRMAEAITRVAPVEAVRMVNSGTEAVMSALRLARAATQRDKIIKFAGCYHGHADAMLVKAGSGATTGGAPDSAGVPAAVAADTLVADYNDMVSVRALFEQNPGEVAALIVEPVAANMGVIPPKPYFLQGLRDLCTQHGALLIFDEVITGFRLALGGAQSFFGIKADLVTYGKIIGAGMPVGAYGGDWSVMRGVAPAGPMYQAGTLSGNPVGMAAGLEQITRLEGNPHIYKRLDEMGEALAAGLRDAARKAGKPAQVNNIGSLVSIFFTSTPVEDYATAKTADTAAFARFFAAMLEQGIYLAPSQFEAMFLGDAHTMEMIDKTIAAAHAAMKAI